MARVVLENLTKVFPKAEGGRVRAVDDLTLTVEDGQWLALVGPSGCGKTTTLRLVAGLEAPTCGTIFVDGQSMDRVPAKGRDIAMVFQAPALYPHLSVYENMAFGLRVRHRPKAEIDQRVREAATNLGIEDYLTRLPSALSGGQCQRVALGRALVRQPKVFLFDEPLASLDPPTRAQLREELLHLRDKIGATVIYVTHDQHEAMTLGHSIAVMKEGRIEQTGAPLQVYDHPVNTFVARFIGYPPMSLLRGTLIQSEAGLFFALQVNQALSETVIPFGEKLWPLLKAHLGGAVTLGLRPEHVTVARERSLDSSWEGEITAVEPTGADQYAHVAMDSQTLLARVPADQLISKGGPVRIGIDARRVHLFQAETGRAIL